MLRLVQDVGVSDEELIRSRKAQILLVRLPSLQAGVPVPTSRNLLAWLPLLLLTNAVVGCGGFCIGGFYFGAVAKRQQTREETEALAPILASDPAFKDVQIQEASSGGVCLVGVVPTMADRARLRAKVGQQLGERWLDWRFTVSAADEPPRRW